MTSTSETNPRTGFAVWVIAIISILFLLSGATSVSAQGSLPTDLPEHTMLLSRDWQAQIHQKGVGDFTNLIQMDYRYTTTLNGMHPEGLYVANLVVHHQRNGLIVKGEGRTYLNPKNGVIIIQVDRNQMSVVLNNTHMYDELMRLFTYPGGPHQEAEFYFSVYTWRTDTYPLGY